MMASNYLSSYVRAELVKNGTTITKDEFPIFFNSISTVQCEVAKGELAKVTVTLTPPYEDAVRILQSGVLGFGNTQSIPDNNNSQKEVNSIGAGGGTQAVTNNEQDNNVQKYLANVTVLRLKFVRPMDTGILQNIETPWYVVSLTQPSFEISGTDVNITLNGYSTSASFGGAEVETNIKDNSTVYDIVSSLAKVANIDLRFDGNIESEMRAKKIQPQVKRDTVFDAIKWALSLVNADFVLSVEILGEDASYNSPNLMTIKKNTDLTKQQPKYRFINWRNPNPESEIPEIPAFNFNLVSSQGLFLSKMAFGVYRLGDDSFTKKVLGIEPIKPDEQLQTTKTEAKTMLASDKIEIKLGFTVPVRSEDPEKASATENVAKNDYTYNRQAYQEMTFDVMGVPSLFPTDMIEYAMADIQELSGKLIVTKVIHNWGAGGWETQVTGNITGGLESGKPAQRA